VVASAGRRRGVQTRRIAILATVTLALAFPAVAVAKTVNYSFILGKA
jgi:hypothetical protein